MWLRVTSGHEAFTASVDQGVRRFVNRRFRPPEPAGAAWESGGSPAGVRSGTRRSRVGAPGYAEGPAPPLGEQRRGGASGAGGDSGVRPW